MNSVRTQIASFLGLRPAERLRAAAVHDRVQEDGFTRKSVSYGTPDGDVVEAFLFEPTAERCAGAVVALHQHNSEWSIGKSEIAGLVGDPLQAFGPALARAGVAVLAPDAIGFESRCADPGHGVMLAPQINKARFTADGWLQYYNQAMHRLVRGQLLMTKILADVAAAVTAVQDLANTDRVGLLGHSYGGTAALFAAALDPRVAFACASGAACSFRHKLAHGTGLDMALVIPGFASHFDLDDLMRCVAPRKLLVVSSEGDPYAADADDLVARAQAAFLEVGSHGDLQHLHCGHGHALDPERFAGIVQWVSAQASGETRMDLSLRAAVARDHRFLHELNRAAYEELAVRLFGSWDEGTKRERLSLKLERGGFRIIELAGEPVGAVCSVDAHDHVFLQDLMILPGFQRRGIGSYILSIEVANAHAVGKPLRLHTSRANEAREFYRRHGFRETGRNDNFIDFERAD